MSHLCQVVTAPPPFGAAAQADVVRQELLAERGSRWSLRTIER